MDNQADERERLVQELVEAVEARCNWRAPIVARDSAESGNAIAKLRSLEAREREAITELLRAAPTPADDDDEFGPVTITEADRVKLAPPPQQNYSNIKKFLEEFEEAVREDEYHSTYNMNMPEHGQAIRDTKEKILKEFGYER